MQRHPTFVLLALVLAASPVAARGQTVNEDPLLPAGTWRLGRITATSPPTVDLTEAHGVKAGDTLTVLRQGSPLGTLTLTAPAPGGFRGRMGAADPPPQASDLVAFRVGDAGEAPAPPVGTIERALAQTAFYVLRVPPEALVAPGQRHPVAGEDGAEKTFEIKEIAGDQAKVFCVGGLAVGSTVELPSRTVVVRTETTTGDPLIGKVACVRFRRVPEGAESEYLRGTILAVDRGAADGPVPCFIARFELGPRTAALRVLPTDVQHVLILEHVPAPERGMARSLWEKERDERDEPYRAWEQTARKFYQYFKRQGTPPTQADLARVEREEQEREQKREEARRQRARGFDPGDLPFPGMRRRPL